MRFSDTARHNETNWKHADAKKAVATGLFKVISVGADKGVEGEGSREGSRELELKEPRHGYKAFHVSSRNC